MASVTHNPKLLMVDSSPSMAQVLKAFASTKDYDADVFADPATASAALSRRLDQLGEDYDCAVVGWPEGKLGIIAGLLGELGAANHADLPLIILSHGENEDAETLAKRRGRTRTVQWKDYRHIEDHVKGFLHSDAYSKAKTHGAEKISQAAPRVLLVDNMPSVCRTLRDALEAKGYQVVIANTSVEAQRALGKERFDLVVLDFYLRGENSEELCLQLQNMDESVRPVYAVMAKSNLDHVVQKSLDIGAIACLDKTESTDMMRARLDAIIRSLPLRPANVADDSVGASSGLVPLSGLVEMSEGLALLLNNDKTIVAINQLASDLFEVETKEGVVGKSIETLAEGISLLAGTQHQATFVSLKGVRHAVSYEARHVSGPSIGQAEDLYVLSLKVQENNSSSVSGTHLNPQAVPAVDAVASAQVNPSAPSLTLDNSVSEVSVSSEVKPISSALVTDSAATLERAIQSALNAETDGVSTSILMVDIKMHASVTGDSMSLGDSQPMLDLVRASLEENTAADELFEECGSGKFVWVLKGKTKSDTMVRAKKLVVQIPSLVDGLTDIRLLSHAAFLSLQPHPSASARHLIEYCTTACIRTSEVCQDNVIFVIGKEVWQETHPASANQRDTEIVMTDKAEAPSIARPLDSPTAA